MSASEELLVFRFKIGREDTLPHVGGYLVRCPKAPAIKLIGIWSDWAVIDSLVDIDELTLTVTLEDIASEAFRLKVHHAEFFADLTCQSLGDILAESDMAAGGRIPATRLYVLPRRTLLQIKLAGTVEEVKMDDGVQRHGAAMGLAARD